MLFCSIRSALALAAGLTVLAGANPAAQAQGGTAPVQGGTAPALPPANVDPSAKTVLDQMAGAYQALKAYSAQISVETTTGSAAQKQSVTMAFQKPNLAKATVSDSTGPLVEIVSDGVSMYLFSPHDKKYLKQALPSEDVIPDVLSQARGALLPTVAANPKFLSRLLAQPGVTIALGTPETVAGVATDTITTTLPSQGQSQMELSFAVATGDHLLRRVTETAHFTEGGQAHTFIHTETVSEQMPDAALTAAAFAFVPPPGAKKVSPEAMQPPMYDQRLKPGAHPFAIVAKDLSGKPLNLAQYRGKVVLMDFWATWCGPCVGEMPNVIAAYKKYHAQGFDVVGISLDQDKNALTTFLAQNKMPWRQVYDGKGWSSQVPRQYGVAAIPFGLLLNRDGTIAAVEVRGAALPAAIRVALAKK